SGCRSEQHGSEIGLAHAGLHGAPVLYVEAQEAGIFAEVVDIAAATLQTDPVALKDRPRLLFAQVEAAAVGGLVADKGFAVGGIIERKAHLVQRVTLCGVRAGKDVGAGNVSFHVFASTPVAFGARSVGETKH